MTSPLRNCMCEGWLPESRFGWTLSSGYVRGSGDNKAHAKQQKAQALLRAVHLAGGAEGSVQATTDAAGLTARDLSFVRGQAPTMIFRPKPSAATPESDCVLSLAHSGDLLLAAATVRAAEFGPVLGIDVEQLRMRDFARIEAHMGWREMLSLQCPDGRQLPDRVLFYRRWTLAESLYKALGKVNHECFAELTLLALGAGRDSGWCSAVVAKRRWFVRWWCVTSNGQPAMVCLLRGVWC